MDEGVVPIELVYVPVGQATIHLHLNIAIKSTIADAIKTSGLLERYPEIKTMSVGIFGKQVALETVLQAGDRVEVYRPLLIDPKEKRRQRAKR